MNFGLGNTLDIDEIEANLADLGQKRKTTKLFSIRAKLLQTAGENEPFREAVFNERSRLAAIFRNHGGEQHAKSAQIFEGLTKPDDILEHTQESKQKPKQAHKKNRQRPFAFHVYGPELNEQEVADMKKFLGSQGKKLGSMNQINPLELLHVLEETYDGRPIYITQALTDNEKLCRQLVVIAQINPRLASRLFILEWNGDIPNPKPITEDPSFQHLSTTLVQENNGMIQVLGKFIYHEPSVGEMFIGRVTRVSEFGCFVEITPGTEGLLHVSEMQYDSILKEGDEIPVVITEIMRGNRIKLSATQAQEDTIKGKKPLFDSKNLRLLTNGESGVDIT